MTTLRIDLVKILAGISDDYSGTIIRLEEYIQAKEDDAVKTYILTGRSLGRSPEITPERMEGE